MVADLVNQHVRDDLLKRVFAVAPVVEQTGADTARPYSAGRRSAESIRPARALGPETGRASRTPFPRSFPRAFRRRENQPRGSPRLRKGGGTPAVIDRRPDALWRRCRQGWARGVNRNRSRRLAAGRRKSTAPNRLKAHEQFFHASLRDAPKFPRAFRKLAEHAPERLTRDTQDHRVEPRDSVRRSHGIRQQRRFPNEHARSGAMFSGRLLQRDLAFQHEKGVVRGLLAGEELFASMKAALLTRKGEQLHRLPRQSVERPRSREPANVAFQGQRTRLFQGSSL